MTRTRLAGERPYQNYQNPGRTNRGRSVAITLALLAVVGGVASAAQNLSSTPKNTLRVSASRGKGAGSSSSALAIVGLNPELAFVRAIVPQGPPPVECYTSNGTWQNDPITTETTPFFAEFDATPNGASVDGVTGVTLGAAASYSAVAVTTRFNLAETLDARDGVEYRADTVMPYSQGLTYHYRLLVYPATHLYTIYVTPPGAPETILGANIHFRDGQGTTSTLNNWTLFTEISSHTVCGFTTTPDTSSDVTAPTVSVSDPAAGATVSGAVPFSANAVDDIGVVGVQLKADGKPIGTELTALPYTRSWDTTAFLNGTHILTATARDAAGNATTSAPIMVTVNNGTAGPCVQSNSVWQNTPIAAETDPFQASFDDTPNAANMDGVTGFSLGNAIDFNFLATIVRFNSSGFIDARNGGSYGAAVSVPYSAGLSYHFRLQIYPATHSYTIFVTPPGSPEITLGTNFAFRTEQNTVSSLDYWSLFSDVGSHTVCNFAVAAIPSQPPLNSLSLSPTSVQGGQSSQGTVTLSGPAPTGGAVVTLSSALSAAMVPSSVTIPATMTSTTFTVTTTAVAAGQTGNISATYNGVTQMAALTVLPAPTVNITFVQGTAASGSNVSSKSLTFPSANMPGNLIVVGVDWKDTQSFVSISDSAGNNYVEAGSELRVAGHFRLRLYYARSIAGGANSVKVTLSGVVSTIELYLHEYSGADTSAPLDAQAGATGTSSSASSGTANTSSTYDLVFGYCVTGTATAGPGFTVRSSFDSNLTEDKIAVAAGPVSATATASSGWALQMAAFKPGIGGPPPISVTVSPTSANVTVSTPRDFTAQVMNDLNNKGANWTLAGAGCGGAACGTLTNVTTTSVTFNAPGTVPNPATVTLTATSITDTSKSVGATITILAASTGNITFVQGTAANGHNVNSKSLAFPSANMPGNLIVVGVDWKDTQSFVSIFDSAGDSYVEAGSELRVAGHFRLRLYYAKSIAGGPNTVTANLGGVVSTIELYLHEYSGANTIAPLDAQSGATGTSSSASSGAANTSSANDLVFGYCVTGTATAGAGFTVRSNLDSNLTEDKIAAAAGPVSATATASSGWALQMAAFKP